MKRTEEFDYYTECSWCHFRKWTRNKNNVYTCRSCARIIQEQGPEAVKTKEQLTLYHKH